MTVMDDPYSTVADSTHAREKGAASCEGSENYLETEDLVRWIGKAEAQPFSFVVEI